jgi:nitrite reductase/ring-hydroxylating ferredoxin subunit
VELVIYRTSQGISVAQDICPHRGTRLSAGWIEGDSLVCPMHGLCYDHSGNCVKIPSVGDKNARIPPRMRLKSLLTEDRYGIVWVCLADTPSHPLPVWPGIGDDSLKNFISPVISGTPLPATSLHGAVWAFDAVYTPVETQFLQDARAAGLSVITGYELFFWQGVHAWAHFAGQPLDLGRLRAELLRDAEV